MSIGTVKLERQAIFHLIWGQEQKQELKQASQIIPRVNWHKPAEPGKQWSIVIPPQIITFAC